MINIERQRRRTYLRTCRVLSVVSAISAVIYIKWLLFDATPQNHTLFYMLLAAELFNIVQAAGFWYTISIQRWTDPSPVDFEWSSEWVDIFITVLGEPLDVVEKTIQGAMAIRHPRKIVWVLDDGHALPVEALAWTNGARYLTRQGRRGAKAGNINAAMARTSGDYIAIFDADHVPEPDFLEKTMGCFRERHVAFVQTPQSYWNRTTNRIAAGAHDQQRLFYGPIMRGRNSADAAFACGTNLVFRRAALNDVGGLPENSITEDLSVSLMLLKRGWRSEYIPIVLAHGMGPVDVGGYFSQQLRWARGGLEILFKRRPFFRGMRLRTRIQFSLSFLYWFTGFAYSVYLILPIAFLLTGQRPVRAPNQYPVYFLPYITVTLFTMAYASDFRINFRALWFTLASFPIHIAGFFTSLLGRGARFVVTSKGRSKRSLRPVWLHIVVIAVTAAAIPIGVRMMGFTPAVMNNVAFALGDILILQGFVRYAVRPEVPETEYDFESIEADLLAERGDCAQADASLQIEFAEGEAE